MKRKRSLWILLSLMLLTGCTRSAASPVELQAEGGEGCKYVALTFDDGPKRETTEALLDGLKARGAKATFFLIGEQVEEARDLVERMPREGHQVGNHSWSHANLRELSVWEAADEVARTEKLLTEILGPGEYWLRPPFGHVNLEEEVKVPQIRWSVDPRDWEDHNAEAVKAHVLSHTEPGAIILLHDIYPSSVEAALGIIDEMQQQGYCFVTVEELLEQYGIEPKPGEVYRSAVEK